MHFKWKKINKYNYETKIGNWGYSVLFESDTHSALIGFYNNTGDFDIARLKGQLKEADQYLYKYLKQTVKDSLKALKL